MAKMGIDLMWIQFYMSTQLETADIDAHLISEYLYPVESGCVEEYNSKGKAVTWNTDNVTNVHSV